MTERESYVYRSKLAEQCERYEDMVENMHKVAEMDQDLSVEERNLLSVAYKNVIGSKRASWRIISSTQTKTQDKAEKGGDNVADDLKFLGEYKKKIEAELRQTCNRVLEVLQKIIEQASNSGPDDSKVFYYKMKGDYYRYLAEFESGDKRKSAAEQSLTAYTIAQKEASSLDATNPIRLGLALNFSVFFYEILSNSEKACKTAKEAFDEAIQKLDQLPEERYKDSTLIMQLLRDNLTLWTTDVARTDGQNEIQDLEQES